MSSHSRLVALRKAAGFQSASQLADASGIDRATISKLENKLQQLTERHVRILAPLLKVHPGELFEPLPGPSPDQARAMAVAHALATNRPQALALWLALGEFLLQERDPARATVDAVADQLMARPGALDAWLAMGRQLAPTPEPRTDDTAAALSLTER